MPKRKPAVCFVTNELYPLGPGGIGRMLYNFAKYNEDMGLPADVHFLVPETLFASGIDARDRLEAALDGIATVHVCPALDDVPSPFAQLLARSTDHPWTSEWLYANSYRYYLGLIAAEQKRGAPFEVIEFPDFGGWATAAIEAKRTGLAFSETVLAARIHSTQGMLLAEERYAHEPGHWAAIVSDAERHLLANADLIVGHDPKIVSHTAKFYGLDDRWRGRVVVEFPPVYINSNDGGHLRADQVAVSHAASDTDDFIFASRLQPIKRPDLFIRAAVLFLERHPEHPGKFRLVCNAPSQAFLASITALIPDCLADRILVMAEASQEDRLYYIDRSIVIVPSHYESLCLFAFEAALAGRKVILNGTCPAFGNDYRWHDRDNCLLFDGSVESLCNAMEAALEWRPKSVVDVVPSTPYWDGEPLEIAGKWRIPGTQPEDWSEPEQQHPLTILCHGVQGPTEFHRHFDSAVKLAEALGAERMDARVIFQLPRACFAPDGPEARVIAEYGWIVAFSSGQRECPEMFGKRIAALGAGELLLFPFGYEVTPAFVIAAARIMRADRSLAIVGGHIGIVDRPTGRIDSVRVYAGEAPSMALLSSRIVPPLCLLNCGVVERTGFDSLAGAFWFEVFARTCAMRGERIAVLPLLAGELDPLVRPRPETTKRISSGLLDRAGIKAGWQSRLLGLDPVQIPSDTDSASILLDEALLRQLVAIHPSRAIGVPDRVRWQINGPSVEALPAKAGIAIAELPSNYRRISAIRGRAAVTGAGDKERVIEMAIGLARSGARIDEILEAAADGVECRNVVVSRWAELSNGSAAEISLPCYAASKGYDKILLMCRSSQPIEEGGGSAVFTSLELFFDNLSVG